MAAELQPPEFGNPITNSLSRATVAPAHNIPPPLPHNPGPTLAPKRHRRPSVRLGDIGDEPATLRTSKPWRLNPNHNFSNKSSKIRPLTNLVTPFTATNGNFDYSSAETTATNTNSHHHHHGTNSHRKFPKEFKSKRTTTSSKRVRTNLWIDQREEQQEQQELAPLDGGEQRINGDNNHDFNEFDDDDDHGEEGFRDFDPDIDQSPIHSVDDDDNDDDDGVNLDMWHAQNRRSIRTTRVSNSHQDLGTESNSRNRGMGLDDGVRKWLGELGLAQYAPVFEIHEVDEEVLPYLTLDDLKDMGINAVGSRRKLYFAIQKLRKGLS